ncbi:MAG: glycosyl hydrolase family 30 [Balneolales bacterium]|nr:glycosyl hydrolase family 30 [Balneolales bacterium]
MNQITGAKLYETSAKGNRLSQIDIEPDSHDPAFYTCTIELHPDQRHQKITGFGGSFTDASASVLNRLSTQKREEVLKAYFGKNGHKYSLTRTHINSCDFSLENYSFADTPDDFELQHFSFDTSRYLAADMIKQAMDISEQGFCIIASPWTAPVWMKDNQKWRGGKLRKDCYRVWALYFARFIHSMKQEGIPVWAVTPENEPLGNDNNWESMHFTPAEMNDFVENHLYPVLSEKAPEVKILGYDQNRDTELNEWATAMFKKPETAKCYSGTAVHWYGSTNRVFSAGLDFVHKLAPEKHIIQTEACIDAQVPRWKDDDWYWSKLATDWGWSWAPDEKKHLHPKYIPVFRYANDIIGCLNHHVDGWVDWNMVLDTNGGPNWAKNWCIAPVIAKPETDEVHYTPLFYVMGHFSRYILPGSSRIGWSMKPVDETDPNELLVTATQNPDGEICVILSNPSLKRKNILVKLGDAKLCFTIDALAVQTLCIPAS